MRLILRSLTLLSASFAAPLWAQAPSATCPATNHFKSADEALGLRHWDAARELYSEALGKMPNDPSALLGLVRADLGLGDDAAAYDVASKQLGRQPAGSTGLTLRAEALYWRGDLVSAGKDFTDAVKANNCNADAHYGLQRVYEAKGYGELAYTEFRNARRIDPGDPAVNAAWLARFGDPTEQATAAAIAPQLKKAVGLDGEDTFLQRAVNNTLKNLGTAPPDQPCDATAPVSSFEQPLVAIRFHTKEASRAGLTVVINGQPLRLLLDTTSDGILLNEASAVRLKLEPKFEISGSSLVVKGKVPSLVTTAKTIAMGSAAFSQCGVRIVRNSRADDFDGTIGTGVFASGIIHLLYQSARFRVASLPDARIGSPVLPRLYTLGLQGHWSSPRPSTDAEFRKGWQGFYLIDGLMTVPGKTELSKEGLLIFDSGSDESWLLSRKQPTHYPAALSEHLVVGYRNEFGLETLHNYLQRTHTDTERADEKVSSIACMTLATAIPASQKLDSLYLANQTGVSFKGILGASWVMGFDLAIDYRDRIYRVTDDHGAGFLALTRHASYFGDREADHVDTTSDDRTVNLPVGIEPTE